MKPTASFFKVLGLLALFTAAPATIYFLYTRTGGPESKKELGFQRNLRYALMAGTETLDLAPLTEWPWVKVCALDSGLSAAEVDAVLGFTYEAKAALHWLHRPDTWTLVFVDAEREASWGLARPVTAIRIPRKELADLRLPADVKGTCAPREAPQATLTRTQAPVGVSPVTISFGR